MRRVTVRFGESLWDLIEDEANLDGVSAAQWIRDAALTRAIWERSRRGDGLQAVSDLIREAHQAERDREEKLVRDVLAHARAELGAVMARLPDDSAAFVRELYGL